MFGDDVSHRPVYMMLRVELSASQLVAVKTSCGQGELLEYCESNGLTVHKVGGTIEISGRIVVGHKVLANGREYLVQTTEPEWIVADLVGLSGAPGQTPRYTLTIK